MAILGVDEVGRGAWAGPLVVGAVVLGEAKIEGLADSKVLSVKKREKLSEIIWREAASVGLGWVSAKEVDKIGLAEALRLATRRAVEQIEVSYHEIIIDGTVNFLSGTSKGEYVTTLRKADQVIGAVSAASIVAKVARDRYMVDVAEKSPGYGFERHVGYGTAAHRAALEKLGVVKEHRLSVRPVQEIYERLSSASCLMTRSARDSANSGRPLRPSLTVMRQLAKAPHETTTKEAGERAEGVVCEYLKKRGHEIIERNWRTRWCEIDIVSESGGMYYLTEVKYRRDAKRGGGMEAITKDKLKRMERAAVMWVQKYDKCVDVRLAAADVAGKNFEVKDWMVL